MVQVIYKCSICGKEYDTYQEALQCEESHNKWRHPDNPWIPYPLPPVYPDYPPYTIQPE